MTQTITPYLWFDDQAEEAANLYVSVFKNSAIESVSRYGDAVPGMEGRAMMVSFRLDGQPFLALNGGPGHPFTDAVSFLINCETQEEVDHYWEKLTAGGGEPGPCGWLKDRFGVSWQVIPSVLGRLMGDEDREKADRVTRAMLQMSKIEIAKLQEAYQGS